jgi:hypothetical protein
MARALLDLMEPLMIDRLGKEIRGINPRSFLTGVSVEAGSRLSLTDITVEGVGLRGDTKTSACIRIPRSGRTDTTRLKKLALAVGMRRPSMLTDESTLPQNGAAH